ncbi:uncharacterized protein LOC132729236 [Ruditapes philippinarum]|uniref:uncharacterized protein LOC132729236 n=1 Tax=Ruditapes philippinarum TaxID=129788 RepID=UPI00295A62FE|nr:uncharacterized protein LOC132729236 [Ruditapes philippinarum]
MFDTYDLGSPASRFTDLYSHSTTNNQDKMKKTTIKPKQPAAVVARGRGQTRTKDPQPVQSEQPAAADNIGSPEEQQQPPEETTEQPATVISQSDIQQQVQQEDQQHQQPPEEETETPSRPLFRISRQAATPTHQLMASFMTSMEAHARQAARERHRLLKGMESLARQNQKLTEEVLALRGLVDGLVVTTGQCTRSRVPPSETMSVGPASLGEMTEGLPEELIINEEELRQVHRDSNNAGHFAALLVKKLFPELYGPTNLRLNYNWYGGGQKKKYELDASRKEVIKRYVTFFHPEVCDSDVWRDRVVPKVNESLRRLEKRKPLQENLGDVNISVSPSAFGGLMQYMNL